MQNCRAKSITRIIVLSYCSRSNPPSRDDLQLSQRRFGVNQFAHESRSVAEEDFLTRRKTQNFGRSEKEFSGQYGDKPIYAIRGGERSKSLKIPFHRTGNVLSAIRPKSRRRNSQDIPTSLCIPNSSPSSPTTGYLKENSCMVTSWHVSHDPNKQFRFDIQCRQ